MRRFDVGTFKQVDLSYQMKCLCLEYFGGGFGEKNLAIITEILSDNKISMNNVVIMNI